MSYTPEPDEEMAGWQATAAWGVVAGLLAVIVAAMATGNWSGEGFA